MTLTHEQVEEMLEAAKPLMRWLADNCHMHCTAVVDLAKVRLTEDVASSGTEEFLD